MTRDGEVGEVGEVGSVDPTPSCRYPLLDRKLPRPGQYPAFDT